MSSELLPDPQEAGCVTAPCVTREERQQRAKGHDSAREEPAFSWARRRVPSRCWSRLRPSTASDMYEREDLAGAGNDGGRLWRPAD
jgi:hypothetical protein